MLKNSGFERFNRATFSRAENLHFPSRLQRFFAALLVPISASHHLSWLQPAGTPPYRSDLLLSNSSLNRKGTGAPCKASCPSTNSIQTAPLSGQVNSPLKCALIPRTGIRTDLPKPRGGRADLRASVLALPFPSPGFASFLFAWICSLSLRMDLPRVRARVHSCR